MKRSLLKMLPSIVTLGNLFCGFLALAYIDDKRLTQAAWMIIAGMIFDVFDGKVARLTNSSSDFGMQLDSLCDMVSFGIVPALLLKSFIGEFPPRLVWGICLFLAICAVLRLARFNVKSTHDESSHTYFEGLATPAAAGVIASLVIIADPMTQVISIYYYNVFLLVMAITLGALMVSHVRYVHMGTLLLKKHLILPELLALCSLIFVLFFHFELFTIFIALGFFVYMLSGPVNEFKIRFVDEYLVRA